MLNEVTNRLDEIVERNHKSRIVDIAFATLIAVLMVMCIASLRDASGRSLTTGTHDAQAEGTVAHVGDAVCAAVTPAC